MHQLPPNPPVARKLYNIELARLAEIHKNLPTPADCVTCQGAKEFLWYANGPGTDVVTYQCNCKDQWILHMWLLWSGVGINYQRLNWFDATHVKESPYLAVLEYAADAREYARRGMGLTLLGEQRGTGKSLLANLLLKRLLVQGFNGYYCTFQRMLDLYTSGWSSKEEKQWFEQRVTQADVLVIDDMGREYEGRLGVAGPMVDHVLRTRYENSLPTIITTNNSLTELGQLYTVNSLSLLEGRCEPIEFPGTDYRPEERARVKTEVKARITRPIMASVSP